MSFWVRALVALALALGVAALSERVGVLAAGYQDFAEGTAPSSPAAGVDRVYADSGHTLKLSVNGGSFFNVLTSSTGCALSGCTMTGALLLQATSNTSGTTAANLWTSNVTATGSADVFWQLDSPTGASNDLAFRVTNNSLARFSVFANGDTVTAGNATVTGGTINTVSANLSLSPAGGGVVNVTTTGNLSGTTVANAWESNVVNSGGVDTAWRLNCSNLADNNDVCLSLFGNDFFTKSGSLGLGASPGEVLDLTSSGAGSRGGIARNSTTTGSAKWELSAATSVSGIVQAFGTGSVGVSNFGTVNDGQLLLLGSGVGLTGLKIGTSTSDPIVLGTNDTLRVTFGATGTVTFSTPEAHASGNGETFAQVAAGTIDTLQIPAGSAATAPTKPACAARGDVAQIIYIDDNDDTTPADLCACMESGAGAFSWKSMLHATLGVSDACSY